MKIIILIFLIKTLQAQIADFESVNYNFNRSITKNPSLISGLDKFIINTSYYNLYGIGIDNFSISAGLNIKNILNFGITYKNIDYSKALNHNYEENIFIFSFGRSFKFLQPGINLKLKDIKPSVDFGIILNFKKFNLAFSVINFYSKIDEYYLSENKIFAGLFLNIFEYIKLNFEIENLKKNILATLAPKIFISENIYFQVGLKNNFDFLFDININVKSFNCQVSYNNVNNLGNTIILNLSFLFSKNILTGYIF